MLGLCPFHALLGDIQVHSDECDIRTWWNLGTV